MLSRRLVLPALAAVVASPIVPAVFAAGTLPADYPQAGCFSLTDPKGDEATPTPEVAANGTDPDLDLLGVALETTPTSLRAYARVDQLSDSGPMLADGHRFTLKFTFNGHVFSASGSDYGHGTGAIRDGLAQTGHAGGVTQLGVDTPSLTDPSFVTTPGYVASGLKVTFDYKNSWVVWDLPIADIEKYGQAKFTGGLTTVGVQAQSDEYAVGSIWDSAPDTDPSTGTLTGTWTVGDNKCFTGGASTAAASVLKYLGDKTAQYGAPAHVSASVADSSGTPVAGAPVTFAIGKLQTSAKTNAKGVAAATLHPTLAAGHYTLVTTTGAGSAKTSVKTPFVVTLAKTVLKLSKSGTTVTATLTDAAKHGLAGQKVSWTINGKSAGTSKTDKAGRAVLKAAKGDHVVATFKAVKGKYGGATAKTTV